MIRCRRRLTICEIMRMRVGAAHQALYPVFSQVKISKALIHFEHFHRILLKLKFSTGTDDEPHEYNFLTKWGPRFDKLVSIYAQKSDIEDDAIS
jgi:hypothetical protein